MDSLRSGDVLPAGAPSRRSVALELGGLAVLTVVFLVVFEARPGYVDVALGLVAVGLIGLSTARSRRIWARCPVPAAGRRARLTAASKWAAGFTLPAAGLFMLAGTYLGYAEAGCEGALARVANWHLAAALLLYFPWALLQQFVFQFYLLGRLLHLLPVPIAVALTGMAFSAVHFPRTPVMAVTLIAGVVWALLYRRYRMLLPLAVSHALLGATLHYWLLGRDLLENWM